MAFPGHFQTPQHDDYKIARFAQLGLMPTAMKSDPYFPAMNWNGGSGIMEIDSSRRDRLSNSAQKKFRRWSRRLNGQHANGSGWVMRHEPRRHDACRDGDWPRQRRRARSQGPPSRPRSLQPLPYDCDVAVSPRGEWFPRSERRRFKLQTSKPSKGFCDDEPLATELPPLHTEHAEHSPAVRRSPRKDQRVQSFEDSCHRRRSRLRMFDPTHSADKAVHSNGVLVSDSAAPGHTPTEKNEEKMPITAESPVILKELRGRKVESPCKSKSGSVAVGVTLPLDASTFFGTKDKSRLSADSRASNADKPRRLSVDLSLSRVEKSRTSIETHLRTVPHEIEDATIESTNKRSSYNGCKSLPPRRRSSQDSDICIVAVINSSDNKEKQIEETPRTCASKSSKKSVERGESLRTPTSPKSPAGNHRESSTTALQTEHATVGKTLKRSSSSLKRSSSSGELKPKAIIKPGLRSAKKDPSKTPAAKAERRRSSPLKALKASQTPQRRLVQKTLDSFFSKSASKSSTRKDVDEKQERPRSAKKIDAKCQVAEETRGHVRRIYQDDGPKNKQPVVCVTPLEIEERVGLLSKHTASVTSSRLAHVTPVPSPAKKRPCEDTGSLPRKMSRRSSAGNSDSMDGLSTKKYDTVRDLSPSCPLKKVFSVSKASMQTEALDLTKRGSETKMPTENISPKPERSRSCSSNSVRLRDLNGSRDHSRSPVKKSPATEEVCDKTKCSTHKKRRKLEKRLRKLKRSPSRKSILGPSDLSHLFKQAYLDSKSEEGTNKSKVRNLDSCKGSSAPAHSPSVEDIAGPVRNLRSPAKSSAESVEKTPAMETVSIQDLSATKKSEHTHDSSSSLKSRDPVTGRFYSKTLVVDQGAANVTPVHISPNKPRTPTASPARLTRATSCSSPAKAPSSESKTRAGSAALLSASPKKTSSASPAKRSPPSPLKDTEVRSPSKPAAPASIVVVQPEEELLQAQQDRAERAAEALKAAQRNKQRHTRGRKVYEYCPVLDEQLERHPVQNEISADKWFKWLNPTQLRCLTLAMLGNKDLCLRYTPEAARVERWESAWVDLSRRLNTVCYNSLTNLNTGLRLTVAEWKKLWLDMRSLIKQRVEALKPSQRHHGLGSLECLLYSEELYAALIKSNGECLGEECPRVWCSGACVGVFCPTAEPTVRRKAEE